MDENNLNESNFAKDDLQKLFSLLNKYNLKETQAKLKQEANVSDELLHEINIDSDISYSLTEQYSKLCEFIDSCLPLHKAELKVLAYPVFVHIYLHLISLKQFVQAKDFFKLFVSSQEKIYRQDLITLQEFSCDDKDIHNSIYEVFSNNQFSLRICRLSYAHFKKIFLDDKSMIELANVINQRLKIDIYEGIPRSEEEINLFRGACYGESLSNKNMVPVLYGNLNDPSLKPFIRKRSENDIDEPKSKRPCLKESPTKLTGLNRKNDSISPAFDNIPLPELSSQDKDFIKDMYIEIHSLPRLRRKRRLFDEDIDPSENVLQLEHNQVNKQKFLKDGIPLNSIMYTMGNMNCQGTSAAFSEDCSMLAMGLSSGILHVRSLSDKGISQMKKAEEVNQIALSDRDINSKIMENISGARYQEMRGHSGGIYDLSWSLNRQQLLSASSDGTMRLWCTNTWSNIAKYRDSGEPLWAVDMAPIYGQYAVTGGSDRTVVLFNLDHLKSQRRFVGDCYGPVTCVKFHNNINYVASGSADRVVRLFDVRSGGMVRSFSGHKGTINCLQFSDDGRYLLSGCDNGSVNIWDLAVPSGLLDSLNLTAEKDITGGPVTSLAFCRDGAALAVGRQAGQVDIWNYTKIIKTNTDDINVISDGPQDTNEFTLAGKRPHPLDSIIDILYTKKTPIMTLQFNRRNMLSCCGVFNQI